MLDHPNIVKLLKTFEENEWYFLVMEYCEVGNLYNYQSKLPAKVFNLEEASDILRQVLEGMEFIHGKGIIHRDIKLENIFLRRVGKRRYVCKIADFGLARPIDGEETAITNCGT